MYFPTILSFTADAEALGRLDYASLSQQAMMELCAGLNTAFNDTKGNFLDIEKWAGVTTTSDGEVVEISWREEMPRAAAVLTEMLDMQWIPPTLDTLSLINVKTCNLEASILPRSLTSLVLIRIQQADCSGFLRTHKLPRGLRLIQIENVEIGGTLDVAHLPPSLLRLYASSCGLLGTIDWSVLPPSIERIEIPQNNFVGSIDILRFPEKLRTLNAEKNKFSGEIMQAGVSTTEKNHSGRILELCISSNTLSGTITYATNVKGTIDVGRNGFTSIEWEGIKSVRSFDASENALEGSLRASKIPASMRKLSLRQNMLTGSLVMKDFPRELKVLILSENQFCGEVDLLQTPKSVHHLDLSHNALAGQIQFSGKVPAYTYLQNNNLSALAYSLNGWRYVTRFDASNNKIGQDIVQLGPLYKKLRYINLCGNDIKSVKNHNGRSMRTQKVRFDNGAPAQRDANVPDTPTYSLKYFMG